MKCQNTLVFDILKDTTGRAVVVSGDSILFIYDEETHKDILKQLSERNGFVDLLKGYKEQDSILFEKKILTDSIINSKDQEIINYKKEIELLEHRIDDCENLKDQIVSEYRKKEEENKELKKENRKMKRRQIWGYFTDAIPVIGWVVLQFISP